MSLENPTIIDKAKEFLKDSAHARIAIYLGIVLLAILAILWAVSGIKNAYHDHQITKARTELNGAVANLKNAEVNLAGDQALDPVHKQDVANKTQAYLDAINASDEQRAVANQAIQNINATPHNVNISVEDLQKKLDQANQ